MASKKVTKVNENATNEQIIKEVAKDLGTVERESLFNVDGALLEPKDMVRSFEGRPQNANAFINSLCNRILKEIIYNRRYTNPLKMFVKGEIKFGDSIQDIFVGLLDRKGLSENFANAKDEAGNLLGKYTPDVKVDYHSINREFKMKVSIEMEQLSRAFLNEGGLSAFSNQLVEQMATSYEYYEYEDVKHMLVGTTEKTSNGVKLPKGLSQRIHDAKGSKPSMIVENCKDAKTLVKKVREISSKLTFMSDKFNLQGVKTHTPKENLIFITTPELMAELDVEVLANAFNVSSTDLQTRTVIIDEMPTHHTKLKGMLIDKDCIGIYNKMNNVTGSFYNPENLRTNIFSHTRDLMAQVDFANAVIFLEGAKQ